MIKLKKDRLAINKFHFKGMHCIYVRVQFYPWFIFSFPLFQTHYHILQYPKTKEDKILTKDKIEPQHIHETKETIIPTAYLRYVSKGRISIFPNFYQLVEKF